MFLEGHYYYLHDITNAVHHFSLNLPGLILCVFRAVLPSFPFFVHGGIQQPLTGDSRARLNPFPTFFSHPFFSVVLPSPKSFSLLAHLFRPLAIESCPALLCPLFIAVVFLFLLIQILKTLLIFPNFPNLRGVFFT